MFTRQLTNYEVLQEAAIDHGGLLGLADDDHPQYVLVTGDTMTGPLEIDVSSATALVVEDDGVNDNVLVVNTVNAVVTISKNAGDFGLAIARTGGAPSHYTLYNSGGYIESSYNSSGFKWTISGTERLRLIGNLLELDAQEFNVLSTGATAIDIQRTSENAFSPKVLMRKSRGTIAVPTAALGGDSLARFQSIGYGATGWSSDGNDGDFIRVITSQNWTDAAHGRNLSLLTTPDGSTTAAIRVNITDGGLVTVGAIALTGLFNVDGSSDIIQTIIQAVAGQTANIVEVQANDTTVLSGFDERGILFSHGGIDVNSVYIGTGAGNIGHTSAVQNIGIGTNALAALTTGDFNIAIGNNSSPSLTTGARNIAIGYEAMFTSGIAVNDSVAIGRGALRENSTGISNIAIGTEALRGITGSRNIGIGYHAGYRSGALSDILIIDNRNRANAADELSDSIIYGVMAATPAAQTLRLNALVGVNMTPVAQLDVDQSVNNAAIPVLALDQADVSEGFVDYLAAAAASAVNPISTWTAGNTIQGFVRVEINGAPFWMPFYDAPTS